jgi:hypothetical protein
VVTNVFEEPAASIFMVEEVSQVGKSIYYIRSDGRDRVIRASGPEGTVFLGGRDLEEQVGEKEKKHKRKEM